MDYSQETLEKCTDEGLDFIECPGCGYDDAQSCRGIKMHYSYADDEEHPGKLSYHYRCKQCEEIKFGSHSDQTYCGRECQILDEVGTLKYKDEDFLREKIEDEGMRAVDIANEIGVKKGTVWEWVSKYDIGDDYECPWGGCDESFASKQGVSYHHNDKHGESIRGNEYECSHCGDMNWTPRSKDDPIFPEYCDDDCFGASMEGENNPNKSDERREKISETMKQNYAMGETQHSERDSEWMMENVIEPRDNSYLYEDNENIRNGNLISKPQFVEETQRFVRSTWEKEIDIMLFGLGIEYQYEPRRYDLPDGRMYMPDFEVGNKVIEVKGYIGEGVPEKVQLFRETYPGREYIVVGEKIPCDIHIPWKDKEELVEEVS